MELTVELEVSQRSAGVAVTKGKLYRGPTRSALSSDKTLPAIPSKYKTIITPSSNPVDAFSSRSQRFKRIANENPGPGAYNLSGKLELETASIGKKGYGNGFVSKTKRFRRAPGSHLGNPTRTPGPGAYSPRPLSTGADNTKRVTPAFQSNIALPVVKDKGPAPNAYNIDRSLIKSDRHSLSSFVSTSSRLFEQEPPDLPGPGTYDFKDPREKTTRSLAAPFKSSTGRSDFTVGDSPGPAAYSKIEFKRAQPKETVAFGRREEDYVVHALRPDAVAVKGTPGPAAYDTDKDPDWKPVTRNQPPFSSNVDRWNYVKEYAQGSHQPGPADYAPKAIKGVGTGSDFHFNRRNVWI